MKKIKALLILVFGFFGIQGAANGQCTVSPPLNLGNDFGACVDSTVTLDAGNGYISYLWNTGSNTQTINVTTTGLYFVRVTDPFGCIDTDTINVIFSDELNVDLGADTNSCLGDTLLLDAGEGLFTYQWKNLTTDQTLFVSEEGSYWVEITDSIGCTASDTVSVTFHPLPELSISGDTTICEGDIAFLDAGPGFIAYIWSNGLVGQSVSVSEADAYEVMVTDEFGCANTSSDEIIVEVEELPADPSLNWDGTFLNTSGGAIYQWFREGVLVATTSVPKYEPELQGNYSVKAISERGCVSTASETLFVTFIITEEDIVEVITPNGDGMNDAFFIDHLDVYPENSLIIMNRWGGEVFRTDNYANDWQGTSKSGKTLPMGTYYYILELKPDQGSFTGFIEIRL